MNLAIVLFLIAACGLSYGQSGQWMWAGGSSTSAGSGSSHAGVYGTQGQASGTNAPGDRDGAMTWTDQNGKLWMFGGEGVDSTGTYGDLNDLWMYDPAGQQWTWEGGSSTLSNCPAAPAVCGEPGTYVTFGAADPGNMPGGRFGGATWVDQSGNLWLFGGSGVDSTGASGELNDVWKFSVSSGQWTWVGGSDTLPAGANSGVYGTLGQFDPANMPGGRNGAVSWIDQNGRLWLFGGQGYDSAGNLGQLNDMWELNATTGEWAWIRGNSTMKQLHGGAFAGEANYGHLGVTGDDGDMPGGRMGASGWSNGAGTLYLFGGTGIDSNDKAGTLNDMWQFDVASGIWTWKAGSSTIPAALGRAGVYGTLGTPAAANYPGSRANALSWADAIGNFWLFGGYGYDSAATSGLLNDLWRFDKYTGQWTWMSGSNAVGSCAQAPCGQPGVYGTQGTGSTSNTPGGRNVAASWMDASGNLWMYGGVAFDSAGVSGDLNDLWEYVAAAPTAPFGYVDAAKGPAGGTTLSLKDTLTVRGWAADAQQGAPVSLVQVLIDGTAVGNATLGNSRPDVQAVYGNPVYLKSGWVFQYAMSGVSLGTHTVTVVATDVLGLSATLPGTKTINVTAVPAPPLGYVDSAKGTSGSSTVSTSGTLKVMGWAADPQQNAPVSQVQVLIDGSPLGNAVLGTPRPDVAAALKNSADVNSGWSLQVSANGLTGGTHTITAVAYDSLGLWAALKGAMTITVVPGNTPFGSVDSAIASNGTPSVSVADAVNVTGWAADGQQKAPVSQVQVLVDGNVVGLATLGIARPDIAASLNNAAYLNSGWNLKVAASGLSLGTHTVTAVATDSLGYSSTLTGTKTITVVPQTPPFGYVDKAVGSIGLTTLPVSDVLTVRGWAADALQGAPVTQVMVLIDGDPVGTATLGIARPDVASALKTPAYLNSGWVFSYAVSSLDPGVHTVTAVATDSNGLSATLVGAKAITITGN